MVRAEALAALTQLAEDILVADRPAHARDRNREEEQQEYLVSERHGRTLLPPRAKSQRTFSGS